MKQAAVVPAGTQRAKRQTGKAAGATPAPDPTAQIEAVATELFIRNGYHGVSYLGIAKQLGITHSNVHYYYRTKAALAEAVLRRVAGETLAATGAIWLDEHTSLGEKFVAMRDWTYQSYLKFNPDGKGGRPWGLLSRFSMEADALSPSMRQTIRSTLRKLEDAIRKAVTDAISGGELATDAPVEGITLQVTSVMFLTGQLTRQAAGFSRLDDLLMYTINGILKAYGTRSHRSFPWPALQTERPERETRLPVAAE